tara:strand:+ start:11894 stop:12052 length:159 start_codon:yes stop_codon:yes gene_type:complete
MEKLISKYEKEIVRKEKLEFHHTTGELVNKFEIATLKKVIKDLNRLKNAKTA